MSANQFGKFFSITSFGESHGGALGVVIDGCPAGVVWNESLLQNELQRRRPGNWNNASNEVVSQRQESDEVEVLSGVFEGKTLGTPIAMMVRNQDARSKDYDQIKTEARSGHADDVWRAKFGHSDHRGGGRSSGRETVSRVMAGAVAQMLIQKMHPTYQAVGLASKIGPMQLTKDQIQNSPWTTSEIDQFVARYPSAKSEQVRDLLIQAREKGESFGGEAVLKIRGLPKGLGQPVFHKLKSDLAGALFTIGAVVKVSVGSEDEVASRNGTDFHHQSSSVYGGIRGGISTGEDITLKVEMKPTSSILDVAKKGRHDPCLVIRAIPILESMIHLVIADHILWSKLDRA